MVCACSFSCSCLPMMSALAPKVRRQSASLRTAERGAPGCVSSRRKPRPSAGFTPTTRKKSSVTRREVTQSTRFSCFSSSAGPPRKPATESNTRVPRSRQKVNCGAVTQPSGSPLFNRAPSCTILSDCGNGRGRSSTAFTTLKIAVFAPMPRGMVNPTTAAKPGIFTSMRIPYPSSCTKQFIGVPPRSGAAASFLCLLDDAAIEQMNVALGEIRVPLIVRNHANGRAVAVQIAQQFHDRLAVLRIEVSSRLVSHQTQLIATQRALHRDTLVLTAREFRRVVTQPVSHPDAPERVLYLLLPLHSARAAIRQRQLHVPIHRQSPDQVERLENKSNLAVAESLALADREVRHRLYIVRILAARR